MYCCTSKTSVCHIVWQRLYICEALVCVDFNAVEIYCSLFYHLPLIHDSVNKCLTACFVIQLVNHLKKENMSFIHTFNCVISLHEIVVSMKLLSQEQSLRNTLILLLLTLKSISRNVYLLCHRKGGCVKLGY